MFDQLETYPGDKRKHFEELHKKTGLPYAEMVSPLYAASGLSTDVALFTIALL